MSSQMHFNARYGNIFTCSVSADYCNLLYDRVQSTDAFNNHKYHPILTCYFLQNDEVEAYFFSLHVSEFQPLPNQKGVFTKGLDETKWDGVG